MPPFSYGEKADAVTAGRFSRNIPKTFPHLPFSDNLSGKNLYMFRSLIPPGILSGKMVLQTTATHCLYDQLSAGIDELTLSSFVTYVAAERSDSLTERRGRHTFEAELCGHHMLFHMGYTISCSQLQDR